MDWKRSIPVFLAGVAAGAAVTYAGTGPRRDSPVLSPVEKIIERPLDKYTVDALSTRGGVKNPIVLHEPSATESAFTVRPFSFETDGKRVTGLAHIPEDASPETRKPVIIQIRGYVDRSIFVSGIGTKRSAEVFAANGYISLAPDYLGYGGSDNPGTDVFEERFQTYTATLDLLASVGSLPQADPSRIGIWAHSNGGQIALTVLEITRGPYPTTLWAPVTRVFPYSILYYTDEADDHGKALRKALARFEENYDTDLYALTNYADRITAPMQMHQGTSDDAVPVTWSNEFAELLKAKDKDITYFTYAGADHNLQPSWNTVVERDLEFFRKHLIP